jgi:hypothetical protein
MVRCLRPSISILSIVYGYFWAYVIGDAIDAIAIRIMSDCSADVAIMEEGSEVRAGL